MIRSAQIPWNRPWPSGLFSQGNPCVPLRLCVIFSLFFAEISVLSTSSV